MKENAGTVKPVNSPRAVLAAARFIRRRFIGTRAQGAHIRVQRLIDPRGIRGGRRRKRICNAFAPAINQVSGIARGPLVNKRANGSPRLSTSNGERTIVVAIPPSGDGDGGGGGDGGGASDGGGLASASGIAGRDRRAPESDEMRLSAGPP